MQTYSQQRIPNMKRLITLAAAIASLTIADSALAQQDNKGNDRQRQGQQQNRDARQGGGKGQQQDRGERRGGGEGQRRGGQGGGGGGLFRLLDTDRDGNLSAKEIDGAVAALMKLDANKDGILDAQELVVRGGGGRDGSGRGSQGRNRGGERGSENSNRRGGGQGNGGKAKQASEN
jgi:Ni/Co efflux regulator RcnB